MEQNSNIDVIELKGIVRNATKLAQQDGQTDELINLRLKDGSWQPTGKGKQVFMLPDGWQFEQMYIHTNVYRHLLGVSNSTLYWIANIDADGVFYTGDSNEPDNENRTIAIALFRSSGEYKPIEICRVTGKVDIMQTGHMITIIDESERFGYFVFKRDDYARTQKYKQVVMDLNDNSANRELYPFGRVNFNYTTSHLEYKDVTGFPYGFSRDTTDIQELNDGTILAQYVPSADFLNNAPNIITILYGEMEKKNLFSRPFLVCAAIKLYDGSYIYASQPTLIYPRQLPACGDKYIAQDHSADGELSIEDFNQWKRLHASDYENSALRNLSADEDFIGFTAAPAYLLGYTQFINRFSPYVQLRSPIYNSLITDVYPNLFCFFPDSISIGSYAFLIGNKIAFTIKNTQILKNNKDIFSSFCIFITPEVQDHIYKTKELPSSQNTHLDVFCRYKDKKDLIYELTHQPFYLLKEYQVNELTDNSMEVDLSEIKYDGLLKSINNGTATEQLTYESINRNTILPKISYLYNGRIHLANYINKQFHGYTIEAFLYSNGAVKFVEKNATDILYGITADNAPIPNLSSGTIIGTPRMLIDFPRQFYPFIEDIPLTGDEAQTIDIMRSTGKPFAYIKTTIETDNGTQIVVRYIPAYDPTTTENGRIDVLESLNPLVCFPDSRATEMEIYVANVRSGGSVKIYRKTLELKAHPYLNLAYYMSPDLKPIDLDFEYEYQDLNELDNVPSEFNTSEYFPNGMKVSKVNNPMNFPAESTYQVGSSEIMALTSNTKAVGTGQTGQAPLYAFTKDGVYGLFVDSSGTVAYHTARILTRDVCNNPKSVTPIDAGVVFTTDRGLMLMDGEVVQELSQPAEGEPSKFYDTSDSVEYCKIAANALRLDQLAQLAGQQTQEDLLAFLKGCIINYNHNERELMVSNPDKSYTYILDRDGNWQKRSYTADEYVNNFPTSYRVKDGVFYKVDEESNADNGVYILTRPLTLGTIAYKQAFRCVVRGVFELLDDTKALGLYVFGSYDGRKMSLLGRNEKRGGMFTDIGCRVERTDVKFYRLCLAGQLKQNSRLDFIEITNEPKLHDKLR